LGKPFSDTGGDTLQPVERSTASADLGGEWSAVSVAERLRQWAERTGDAPAVITDAGQLSFAELDARVDRAAVGLAARGLAPGDRLALMAEDAALFAEALFAGWRAGLVVVPVNPALAVGEAGALLTDAGARVLVTDAACAAIATSARDAAKPVEALIAADGAGGHTAWEGLTAAEGPQGGGSDAEPVEVTDEALALIQYTSGTTGRPRGAMLTHANLSANHDQLDATAVDLGEGDVVLCTLPLAHIYGLNAGLVYPLTRGATVVAEARFEPRASLATIARHRVSIVVAAPPAYLAWLDTPGVGPEAFATVRHAVSGAATLPARVRAGFTDELGVAIWDGYGATEASPAIASTAMDGGAADHAHGGQRAAPGGSVGRPLPGVELRLVGDDGQPVAQGDPGEVCIQGPNVFTGYWNDPDATAEVLDADGFFHTGDVGYADEGAISLVDRKTDLIIVSGFNVYPAEVERVLAAHPKVAEASVVGVDDARTGEAVKAVVVPRAGEELAESEVTDLCRTSMARFKCPAQVEVVTELPRDAAGKVVRRALR
jgi:long-chain acyl-CoA synthetase